MTAHKMSAEDLHARVPVANAPRKITLPVYYRDEKIADARMDPDMQVQTQDLAAWIKSRLRADVQEQLMRHRSIPADGLAPLGLSYDAEMARLVVRPAGEFMQRQDIAIRGHALAPGEEVVMPAAISGFANFRLGQDIVTEGGGGTAPGRDGRQPLRIDTDGAINIRNWVLEGRADYLEDASHSLARRDVRLVRDLPDKMVRLAAGDLSYPVTGFQSYQPMLGVSVARNFSLQPYRVTVPTGETSFTLDSPARVDVLVNGQRARTLRLDPGSYDISDFPVADGGNEVTLEITDAAGRVERKTFSLFSDQQLLQKGLHEFAYNAGIRSETVDRKLEYDAAAPGVSLFHRYGFSDTVTGGLSAQGDRDTRQAALSGLMVTKAGTFARNLRAVMRRDAARIWRRARRIAMSARSRAAIFPQPPSGAARTLPHWARRALPIPRPLKPACVTASLSSAMSTWALAGVTGSGATRRRMTIPTAPVSATAFHPPSA